MYNFISLYHSSLQYEMRWLKTILRYFLFPFKSKFLLMPRTRSWIKKKKVLSLLKITIGQTCMAFWIIRSQNVLKLFILRYITQTHTYLIFTLEFFKRKQLKYMRPKLEIPSIWIYTHNSQNGKKYKKIKPTEC